MGAEKWPAVTDRAALSEADVALFLKANAVAEELRHAAEERFVADLPRYETGRGNSRDPLSGIDFVRAIEAVERARAGIEAAACEKTGVPLAEYQSTYKRLLQVNDLTLLEVRTATTRESVARLAEDNLNAMAEEAYRFQRQRERQDLQAEAAQLAQRRTRSHQLREGQRKRERARIEDRLRRLPGQEQKLRDRLAMYGQVRDHQRGIVDRHTAAVRDRQRAAAAGVIPAAPDDRQEAQIATAVAAKTTRLDTEIDRTEKRLAQLAFERHELEAALARLPPAGEQEPDDDERDLEAQLADLDRKIAALDAQIEHGGSADELAPLVATLRAQSADKRHELAQLERELDTPAMRQAERDRPLARRHTHDLVASGTPILVELPPAAQP
ncbi:hypothetical protein L6Q96_02940 [Candidatus Binatia bacterium]|nr:hypothetical protein [Candidatus Binatia bacterium]